MEAVVPIKETKPKTRIDYLDIAKFLGIILVILGHTTGNFDKPLYRIVLYSFHMPLFFILSGFVIKKPDGKYDLKHWLGFFKKNLLALAVPYFIWALVYGAFSYSMIPNILYGSYEKILASGTLSSLWYIPCLLTGRIFAELMMMVASYFKKIKSQLIILIEMVILFTVGFLLPHPEIGYFWGLDVGLIVAGFMLFGYLVKPLFDILYQKSIWFSIILLAVGVGLLVGGILGQNGDPKLILICRKECGNLGFFFLNAIAGTVLVLSLSMIISKLFSKHKHNIAYRFMLWVGANSIGFYLIHKNFLQEICMANLAKWGVQLPHLGFAILATIVAFIFSSIVVFVINKIIPQLFGKFPKHKDMVLQPNSADINELSRNDSENNK